MDVVLSPLELQLIKEHVVKWGLPKGMIKRFPSLKCLKCKGKGYHTRGMFSKRFKICKCAQ